MVRYKVNDKDNEAVGSDSLPVIILVVDVQTPDDQEEDPRYSLQQGNLLQPARN